MSRHGVSDAALHDELLTLEQYRHLQQQKRLEREARLYRRDVEYKIALGLPIGQPLPKALGPAGGTRRTIAEGIRATKRLGGAV